MHLKVSLDRNAPNRAVNVGDVEVGEFVNGDSEERVSPWKIEVSCG